MIIQQGDVLLKSVDSIPKGKKVASKNGVFILAEGEATGHAHKISSEAVALTAVNKELYITVEHESALVHEEHKTRIIPPGKYYVDKVREKDWFDEQVRKVLD